MTALRQRARHFEEEPYGGDCVPIYSPSELNAVCYE